MIIPSLYSRMVLLKKPLTFKAVESFH